jgi:hypothetical protein
MSPISTNCLHSILLHEIQLKLKLLSARPNLKEEKLDDCRTGLKINHPTSKIVQVKHLRCCYNILAALQEFYDCEFSIPLWFARRLYKSSVLAVMVNTFGGWAACEPER